MSEAMKRILVCLDDSPRAPFVLATAAELAKRVGGRMCLLRAVGIPPEMDRLMSVKAGADLIETMTDRAKLELKGLAAELPASAIEGLHVHIGTPWDSICREAKELDCDIVVIGSHGYSGFDRVLGTTAAKVVNHCDRSVFVVRQSPRTPQ
jgi:universal stress protein F